VPSVLRMPMGVQLLAMLGGGLFLDAKGIKSGCPAGRSGIAAGEAHGRCSNHGYILTPALTHRQIFHLPWGSPSARKSHHEAQRVTAGANSQSNNRTVCPG